MPIAKNAYEQQMALMNPGNQFGLTPDPARDENFNLKVSDVPVPDVPATDAPVPAIPTKKQIAISIALVVVVLIIIGVLL